VSQEIMEADVEEYQNEMGNISSLTVKSIVNMAEAAARGIVAYGITVNRSVEAAIYGFALTGCHVSGRVCNDERATIVGCFRAAQHMYIWGSWICLHMNERLRKGFLPMRLDRLSVEAAVSDAGGDLGHFALLLMEAANSPFVS
jgi:hypothetical protein